MNTVEVHLDDTRLVPESTLVGRLFRDTSRRGDIFRSEYNAGWLTKPAALETKPLLPLPEGPFHASDPTPDTRVLIAQHAFFRPDARQAAHILEEVRSAVRPWTREAKTAGPAANPFR